MKENIGHLRKSYEKAALEKEVVKNNPLELFRKWFYEAQEDPGIAEANAMTLATLGVDSFPRARVVLLKEFNEEGFVFYTNYDSDKGQAILQHPHVGLSFFWPSLERQVIIKGKAEKTTNQISDNYFQSRPKGSQLGALVSPQSTVIPDRNFLEKELKRLELLHTTEEIKRPEHWGGFIVRPNEIEFWQGRPNRLHDRIRCRLNTLNWIVERLAP